jgi:DNA-binding NarL/FixJ family response regulator
MHLLKTYIVEDSAVIREDLIAALEELTAVTVVGSAADEQSAVQWLSDGQHAADLVIVDLFLQAGSGLGVLRAIGPRRTPRTRWVVLSNFATPDMRRRCLELGADAVFDKSKDIDALMLYCRSLAGELPADAMPAPQA